MAKQTGGPIKAWSYSRYTTYKQCPLKAKLQFVDKIFSPKNDAMERGNTIHKLCEDYIKGKISRLPKELKLFADDFKALKAQYKKKLPAMTVEDTWAFTKDWDETVWNDWARCWVRIKLDCGHFLDKKLVNDTLIVTDFKTGKFREYMQEDYIEQLELYATGALLTYSDRPELIVKPRLMYLDAGVIYPEPGSDNELIFTQKDLKRLLKLWEKRSKPMLMDKKFAPRANNFCSWCHFRKASTGHCKF